MGERGEEWEAAMQSQTSLTPHLAKNSSVQNLLILIGSLVKAPAWALSENSKYKKAQLHLGVKHKPQVQNVALSAFFGTKPLPLSFYWTQVMENTYTSQS